MSRGLIYSTRGVTSPVHQSLIQQMRFVETMNTEIDFLSPYKSDKSVKYIEKTSGIKIQDHVTHLVDQYHSTLINLKSWTEIYDAIDVDFLKKYTDLYLFGGLFSSGSDLRRYTKRCGVFPCDHGQIKFQSVAIPCVYTLALLKANRLWKIRLHEIVFDPLEMSLDLFHPDYCPVDNYYLYHGYDKPELKMRRLDSLQYYLSTQTKNFIEQQLSTKDIDITFGMTVMEGFRQKYEDYAKTVIGKFNKSNFYVLNKVTGENNFVDRTEYLYQISRSQYTIILPAYDLTCFSIYRLIESLHNDCLPMINEDCYLEDMNKSFNIDLGKLVTDRPWSDSDRVQLLETYKQAILTVKNGFCK